MVLSNCSGAARSRRRNQSEPCVPRAISETLSTVGPSGREVAIEHRFVDPRQGPQSKDAYAPGNIVTVEPGLYIPGFGGVRIEDNILLTADGIENLTTVPKELLELPA